MPTRPHILVTNDDGITSPGIQALAAALREVGRITVVAPDSNWSISGHQKTLRRFLRADPFPDFPVEGVTAYASSGAPADCVAISFQGLLRDKPDMVVSGINIGPNLGQDITYSGTVAAAFETAIFGYPAVAVSLNNRSPRAHFGDAATVGAQVAAQVWANGLPSHSLINVNVPDLPASEWQGIAVTRLGVREYTDELVVGEDPAGRPYYWINSVEPGGKTELENTDIWAVHRGYVSVTPIRLDMTDDVLLSRVQEWEL